MGKDLLQELLNSLNKRKCSDHKPVQHRDARPPWCKKCGLTASFEKPKGRFDDRK